VRLDPDAYPGTRSGGRTIPLPAWICRAPDGGLHPNAGLHRIDVDVAAPPNSQDEINWICDYGVDLIAHSWLEEIRDLIDGERIGLGTLRWKGEVLGGWSTIHERRPPALLATEGRSKTCPLCGNTYTVLHGREFFSEPEAIGRALIVNRNGLFIREDIARSRNLRTPRGAFEPPTVGFELTSH
jgi:hypothetical protein